MMKWFYVLIILLVPNGLSKVAAEAPVEYMQALAKARYHKFSAQSLGRDFHIYVSVPSGYEASSKKLPVLYLLDGGYTFPMLVGYYNYLKFENIVPEMIIVGISYGNDESGVGNFRSTDYTAPAASRGYYGGASVFQEFLSSELMPFLEGRYRIDKTKRIIFGQSLGGQFVLYTAQTRPNLFWGHISSNPALHRNLEFFMARPLKLLLQNLFFMYLLVKMTRKDLPSLLVSGLKIGFRRKTSRGF